MKIQRGFTLIEIMIVVGIIAIFSVIAFPMYRSQVEAARLSDARSALTDDAHFLARWYANNGKYISSTKNWAPLPISETEFFDIKFLGDAANSDDGRIYTLIASPKNANISDKHVRIDQDGNIRTCTGSAQLVNPTSCS